MKALIKDKGLFAGQRKDALQNYLACLQQHGFPGLCKSPKLFETSSLQAKERQVSEMLTNSNPFQLSGTIFNHS